MSDYISREEALKPYMKLNDSDVVSVYLIKKNLMEQDSVDVSENINDIRFIPENADIRGYTNTFRCSNCGEYIYTHHLVKDVDYEFCPWCGGKAE